MYKLKQFTLLSGDLLCLYIGLMTSLIIRQGNLTNFSKVISPMTILFFVAIIIFFVAGLYDLLHLKQRMEIYGKLALAGTMWIIVGIIFFYLNIYTTSSPKTILGLTGLIGISLIAIWRIVYNRLLSTTIWKVRIAFVGMTPETQELINFLNSKPQLGYQIIGILFNETPTTVLPSTIMHYQIPEKLPPCDMIIVAPVFETNKILINYLYKNIFRQTQIESVASFYEKIMKRIPTCVLSETWCLVNLQEQNKKVYDRIKLILDYGAVFFIALFFIIIFPIIALLVKITSPGPIFYTQNRVGRNEKIFKLYKFRTMKALSPDGSAEINGPQYAQIKDDRITWVGQLLRRTRLDELPQIINIIRGEMALIGPRPERPTFVKELTHIMKFYPIRHLIKPGLTGWAQLQHNYYGTINENLRKIEYDLYYIKNRGPLLDLSIILHTINVILGLKGR